MTNFRIAHKTTKIKYTFCQQSKTLKDFAFRASFWYNNFKCSMVIGFFFLVLCTGNLLAATKMLDTTKGEQGSV